MIYMVQKRLVPERQLPARAHVTHNSARLTPQSIHVGDVGCDAGSGMRGRSCAGSNMRTAAGSLRSYSP